MPKTLRTLLCATLATLGLAHATDTFDATTNQLTIPAVQIGDTIYTNVVIRLNNFDVLAVGGSTPANQVSDTCTPSNITLDRYNAIQTGMTLDQVNQALGCKPFGPPTRMGNQAIYIWRSITPVLTAISVSLDPTALTVMSAFGKPLKSSSGI